MIRRRDDTTIIITQTAHGWLSGQFAMRWGNENFQFPALAGDVIMATINHDNGWMVWEENPRLDDRRRPLDFLNMPVATHIDLWRQGIGRLTLQNEYAALLVSLHSRYLVENRLQNNTLDSDADKAMLEIFSREQRSWEAGTLTRLKKQPYFAPGCERHRLEANLRLLQVFDWFSLLLCMRKLSETVVVDVPGAAANQRVDIRIRPTGSRSFTMTPWPFNSSTFDLALQIRHLPQPTFERDELFQAAWLGAEVKLLVFKAEQT